MYLRRLRLHHRQLHQNHRQLNHKKNDTKQQVLSVKFDLLLTEFSTKNIHLYLVCLFTLNWKRFKKIYQKCSRFTRCRSYFWRSTSDACKVACLWKSILLIYRLKLKYILLLPITKRKNRIFLFFFTSVFCVKVEQPTVLSNFIKM